ncbi:MAG TPA: sugar ABC transporter substrate-binding protein [Chloroflexota bacterium]|nr:sugar ABC transporter substrate-binding protein [Chloroflexota bacterium]
MAPTRRSSLAFRRRATTRRASLRSGMVAGISLAGSILAACGAATERSSRSEVTGAPAGTKSSQTGRVPAGTVLTYLSNHNQSEGELIKASMDRFGERFPGAKVDFQIVSNNATEKLQAMLSAGTPPDMFRTGGTAWAQFANQGAMAEIGSHVKRDKYDLKDFIEAAVKQYFWKGKHIGLGSNVGYSLIYYNTSVFSEHGIPSPSDSWAKPWTWEQFTDALRRVTTRGPDGEPQRFGFTDLAQYHRIMVTNGAKLTNDDETRTLYDTPEAVDTWEWMYDLVHGQKVAQNPLTHKDLQPKTAFISAKAVTWVTSTANGMSQLVPQKDVAWNVAPTPKGPRLSSDDWVYGGGSAWWIAAESKQVDATWELMKYMQSPEVGRALAAGGFAPIRYSILRSPVWLRSDQPPSNKKPLVDGLERLLPFPKLTNWASFNKAINDEVQALWKGERRGKEVAERIRQATDPILAEHQAAVKEGK